MYNFCPKKCSNATNSPATIYYHSKNYLYFMKNSGFKNWAKFTLLFNKNWFYFFVIFWHNLNNLVGCCVTGINSFLFIYFLNASRCSNLLCQARSLTLIIVIFIKISMFKVNIIKIYTNNTHFIGCKCNIIFYNQYILPKSSILSSVNKVV